jgi:hypothetical protein
VVGELAQPTKRLPAWARGARAEIAVMGNDGSTVASQRVDVKPAAGALVFQLPETGGVPAGEYTVRIRLRSPVDGELGLSDTARISIKASAPLGEAVLWRRGPSTGPQHQRTADPRFQRSERIRLELASSSTEAATARVIAANGQPMTVPVEVSERPDSSGSFTWVVVDLVLAPFGPADYAIDVAQGDARQLTAFRVIP